MQKVVDEAGLSQATSTHNDDIEVNWSGKFILFHYLQQVEVWLVFNDFVWVALCTTLTIGTLECAITVFHWYFLWDCNLTIEARKLGTSQRFHHWLRRWLMLLKARPRHNLLDHRIWLLPTLWMWAVIVAASLKPFFCIRWFNNLSALQLVRLECHYSATMVCLVAWYSF